MKRWDVISLIVVGAVVLAGGLMALLDGTWQPLGSWGIYGVSLAFVLVCGFAIWRRVSGDRRILAAVLSAFLLRLSIGVLLAVLLPIAGYQDSQVSRAGYVFKDAYVRDRQAWDLASSSHPISLSFGGNQPGDQYGGMLALSAWVYRYLSPDAHRPYLILILTAAISALGLLWASQAAKNWFSEARTDHSISSPPGERISLAVAWIMALYPESILLGSSQMREAFVIAGIALAFYAFSKIHLPWRSWSVELGLAIVILFLFQPPIAFASLVVLIILISLEPRRRLSWKPLLVIVLFALMSFVLATLAWQNLPSLQQENPLSVFLVWFQRNFSLQTYMLERVSGWSQRLIQQLGEGSAARLLVVLVYGAAQPVLPAALVVPGAPIWMIIGTLRAAGWYALLPLLLYGFWVTLQKVPQERRAQRIWLSIACLTWTLVAAANGGADQWDNPRYRTIFLVWMALLAAWAWWWSRSQHDPWLGRLLIIETIFLLVFIEWYLGRYYPQTFIRLDIWVMIAITLVAGVIILGWGWMRDRKRKKL